MYISCRWIWFLFCAILVCSSPILAMLTARLLPPHLMENHWIIPSGNQLHWHGPILLSTLLFDILLAFLGIYPFTNSDE